MRRESLEDDVDMARRVRSSARPRSTVRNCHVTTSTRSYVPRLTFSSQLLLDQRAALGTTDLRAGGGLAWIDVSALLIRQLGGPTCGRGTWCILVNVASLVGVEVPVTLAPFTAQRLEGAHHSFGGATPVGLPNKMPPRCQLLPRAHPTYRVGVHRVMQLARPGRRCQNLVAVRVVSGTKATRATVTAGERRRGVR